MLSRKRTLKTAYCKVSKGIGSNPTNSPSGDGNIPMIAFIWSSKRCSSNPTNSPSGDGNPTFDDDTWD
ncbi:hypothetical protein SPLC1_S411550 [Arthrospira platensis C1]|nr:hypothetical protein SPLC1_S411550 [Arthrospira platensis C1]